jgi:hypothetical protein
VYTPFEPRPTLSKAPPTLSLDAAGGGQVLNKLRKSEGNNKKWEILNVCDGLKIRKNRSILANYKTLDVTLTETQFTGLGTFSLDCLVRALKFKCIPKDNNI